MYSFHFSTFFPTNTNYTEYLINICWKNIKMGKEAHKQYRPRKFFIFQGKGEIRDHVCQQLISFLLILMSLWVILCISNLHFIFLYLRHLTYVLLLVLQEPVIFMQVFYWGMFLRPTPIRQGGNYGRLETEVGVSWGCNRFQAISQEDPELGWPF